MGSHSGVTAAWFPYAYIGTFVLFTGLALWWLVDVVRRPRDAFPAGWPVPRLRWGLVPGVWLVTMVLQALVPLGALVGAQKAVVDLESAANVGLVTIGLLPVMIVAGFAYLLRVVFPKQRPPADETQPPPEA